MNQQKAYIVILFFIGLCASEMHQAFPFTGKVVRVNWFMDAPEHLPTLQWYLRDALLSCRDVIWMYASYRMARMIDLRLSGLVSIFLVYCVLDLLLYFICYRMYGYGIVYIITGLFSVITIFKRK